MSYAKAFKELKKMGVPAFKNEDGWFISAEDNDDEIWADYYEDDFGEFGVNMKIVNVLRDYGLFPEWVNPGLIGVYKA